MQSENLEILHSLSFLLWIVFSAGGIIAWAYNEKVLGFTFYPYREYAFPLFFGCIVFLVVALVTRSEKKKHNMFQKKEYRGCLLQIQWGTHRCRCLIL